MNILFFHKNGIHPNSGGISRISWNLCQLFREHDLIVRFLSIRPIRFKNYLYDPEQTFLPDENLFSERNLKFVLDYIASNQINIIINQSAIDFQTAFFWGIIRQKSDIKVVSCMHNSLITPIYNFPYQREWRWKQSKKKWLYKIAKHTLLRNLAVSIYIHRNRKKFLKLEQNSDKIVFLCDGLADEYYRIIARKSSKVTVIPNFNDVYFVPEKREDEILWVGTVDFAVKRIDFMLDVWKLIYKSMPSWNLKILGDGYGLEEACRYAELLGLENYYFEGRVSPESYYKKAKIVCVTSSHEAFPLVTLEAMGYGVVPIIINSFPAASMLVANEINGILVKPFSREDFAQAIMNLMNSPDKLKQLSEHNIESAQKYTGENIFKLWISLFQNLING